MKRAVERIEIDRLVIEGDGIRETDADALRMHLTAHLERALQEMDPASLTVGTHSRIEAAPVEWPAGVDAGVLAPQVAAHIAAAIRQKG